MQVTPFFHYSKDMIIAATDYISAPSINKDDESQRYDVYPLDLKELANLDLC